MGGGFLEARASTDVLSGLGSLELDLDKSGVVGDSASDFCYDADDLDYLYSLVTDGKGLLSTTLNKYTGESLTSDSTFEDINESINTLYDTAYARGYADGLAMSGDGTIEYEYHYHTDSCYTTWYAKGCNNCGNGVHTTDASLQKCGKCGASWQMKTSRTWKVVNCGMVDGQILSAKVVF